MKVKLIEERAGFVKDKITFISIDENSYAEKKESAYRAPSHFKIIPLPVRITIG